MSDKKTILLVEDEDEISYVIEFMLKREGYTVTRAKDGKEALDLVKNINPPSLILLDIMLPFHDGFEILSTVRKMDIWKEVPVIMLSAKSMEGDVTRAIDQGADDYINKPFQPEELKSRIRRYIK